MQARRSSLTQSHRKLVADQLLNRAAAVAEPKMMNTQSRLKARGEFDKRSDETQQEWAARMRAESARVDANIQKIRCTKTMIKSTFECTPS